MSKTTECSSCPESRPGTHFEECPDCASLLCPDCVDKCLGCWADANKIVVPPEPTYVGGWRSILCRLFDGSLVWRVTAPVHLDGVFFRTHHHFCPDLKENQ